MQLGVADGIVMRALKEGIDKGMHYKYIYVMVKERIENYGKIICRTQLLLPGNTDEAIIVPMQSSN